MKNIAVIAVLALLALNGASGIPQSQSVPDDLEQSQAGKTENSCQLRAWQHYELVLAGPVTDRADNFYLAETYQAMAQANFNC